MKTHDTEVTTLVDKAAKASDSNDALKFSQAALNVAHAAQVLRTIAQSDRDWAREDRVGK